MDKSAPPSVTFGAKQSSIKNILNIVESVCPEMDNISYIGYVAFGIFVPLFLWLIIFKLRGGVLIPKLAFNYQMGGIKDILSSKYLSIGE
jgi:hypothetical protein